MLFVEQQTCVGPVGQSRCQDGRPRNLSALGVVLQVLLRPVHVIKRSLHGADGVDLPEEGGLLSRGRTRVPGMHEDETPLALEAVWSEAGRGPIQTLDHTSRSLGVAASMKKKEERRSNG